MKIRRRAAFVLLEVMLGVAIFSIGVIALGRCFNNCLNAEMVRAEDQRARLALQNRMAEIESGSVLIDEPKTEPLEGQFTGITLQQSRTALKLKNENGQDLPGLYEVKLAASWTSDRQPQAKELSFYVLRTK